MAMAQMVNMQRCLQHLLLAFLGLGLPVLVSAQAPPPPGSTANGSGGWGQIPQVSGILRAEMIKKEVVLEDGQIVSNVLRVYNPSDRPRSFRVEVTEPTGWRSLVKSDQFRELRVGDSAFIPIRLIPSRSTAGSRVIINALVFTGEEQQVAQAFFYAVYPKKSSWELDVPEGRKVYFPNGATELDFRTWLHNSGTGEEDIFVHWQPIGEGLALVDSNGNELGEYAETITLSNGQDTTLPFTVRTVQGERNFRNVSIISHRPDLQTESRRYSVMVRSSEPLTSDSVGYSRATRVEFLSLPNATSVQDYGTPVMPLVVEAQYQNILGQQSIMALNLNGMKPISQDAHLVYFSQFMFRQNYINNVLEGAPWYVGYFDPSYTFEIGTVNGAMPGINTAGRGIRAGWHPTREHRIAAFYVRSPYLRNPTQQSFGLTHEARMGKYGNFTTSVGRNVNDPLDQTTDVASATMGFTIKRNHFLSFNGAYSSRRRSFGTDSTLNRSGYLAGANYSAHFFNRKLAFSLGGQYNSRFFGAGNMIHTTGNSRLTYRFSDRWDAYLTSTFLEMENYGLDLVSDTVLVGNRQWINNLVFNNRTEWGTFQPGLYYNVLERSDFQTHSRGLSLRYSNMDFTRNFLFTMFAMGGYDDPLHLPEVADYFTFRLNLLMRRRTLTLNASYQYGALSSGALDYQVEQGITPQFARLSLNHQYLFRDRHFVMENGGFYTFNNQFSSHSIGYYPRIYYFSNTGWRFELQFGWTLSSNNYQSAIDAIQFPLAPSSSEGNGAQVSNNFTFGAGVRKEFGLPIPFAKAKAANAPFKVFYDLNGNGIRDAEEPPIENVVLNIGGHEIITEASGEALIRNIGHGAYSLMVIPLNPPEGWFANVEDSILVGFQDVHYIPFVRGVKVEGNVIVNRQRIAAVDQKPLDLTNIKITATEKSTGRSYGALTDLEGNYHFYLPNGTYILSMDESILGKRLSLAQNNFEVTLDGDIESVYTSFYIAEKERKVKVKTFNPDGSSSTGSESGGSSPADSGSTAPQSGSSNGSTEGSSSGSSEGDSSGDSGKP